MSVYLSVCLFLCLLICLSVYFYVCNYVCLFIPLCVNLFVCLFLCLSVIMFVCVFLCSLLCFSVYLSICLFVCLYVSSVDKTVYWDAFNVCLFIYLPVNSFVCLSICSTICLSVCLSRYLLVYPSACLYIPQSVQLYDYLFNCFCPSTRLCVCPSVPSNCLSVFDNCSKPFLTQPRQNFVALDRGDLRNLGNCSFAHLKTHVNKIVLLKSETKIQEKGFLFKFDIRQKCYRLLLIAANQPKACIIKLYTTVINPTHY
jgi:hypothetical protein